MSAAVVRINVTESVKNEFLSQFAGQSAAATQKLFAAKVVSDGLKKLEANGTPPGSEPRNVPTAQGGNKGIEFSRADNRDLINAVKKFRQEYKYLSLPVAYRACLYAGLDISQPWT